MRDRSWRVVLTLTACTALALMGDSTLYAVLPARYGTVGVTALQVGWLLSINRLVRVPANLVSGRWVGQRGGRVPFILGMALGAISTLGYAMAEGFWPLVLCRMLWGAAWALIIVAANTLLLQVSTPETRGRNAGIYSPFSFFGGSIGAMLGGLLVDRTNFGSAMLALGGLTSLGLLLSLTLPHVQSADNDGDVTRPTPRSLSLRDMVTGLRSLDARLALVLVTVFFQRFFLSGVFYGTLAYYVSERLGDSLTLGQAVLGAASLSAALFLLRNVVTIAAGPSLGHLSDKLGDRAVVLALGVVLGASGLAVLAATSSLPFTILGVALVAIAFGIIPPLLISWVGDLTPAQGRSGVLGIYQTVGDLGAGLGPLVAYPLLRGVGITAAYALCAAALLTLTPWLLRARRRA